jgi:pyridoxamine 5'-phosphate oxidase
MAGLHEADVAPDPVDQFLAWYGQADSEAVALATASADGVPSVRMVLLRGADRSGFVFYTNFDSAKARDLAVNPRAALCFFWPPDRQVRVSGPVHTVGEEESVRYWRNRPRASQLSAWASRQSQVVEFWHHREDRLHDRIRYRREDGRWVIERLAP